MVTALGAPPVAAGADSPFASRVMDYSPAPGQFVNVSAFNDPARALGAPAGGGPVVPDNTKVVTLGAVGGSITLGFDAPIPNLPASVTNPRGCDLIIYGNAFFSAGDPARRFAEAATVEVSRDDNGNGQADDAWYLIRGSHTSTPPALHVQTWDTFTLDATNPPANAAWIPPGRSGVWTTQAYVLPAAVFAGLVLVNPLGESSPDEGVWGYADCSPTMVLGDLDGDGLIGELDDPAIPPERFYAWPDDPLTVGVWRKSGGGDAVALEWAIDPATGQGVTLDRVDFVRITTAAVRLSGILGELSAEVSAVAMVRPRLLADVAAVGGSWPPDGQLTVDDIIAFVNAYGDGSLAADVVSIGGTLPPDEELTVDDLIAFVNAYSDGGG
jgi:hypothetical protein